MSTVTILVYLCVAVVPRIVLKQSRQWAYCTRTKIFRNANRAKSDATIL
jgi:hypothetical protein